MGWGAGAAIAAHVAGVEKVNGKIPNRVLGSVPASSDTVESERRQMKQC
jgi:hypothetical protein